MLVYKNDKLVVLSMTRCGHTSMYEYLGLEPYSFIESLHFWRENPDNLQRVLVVRNPYDRVASSANRMIVSLSNSDYTESIPESTNFFLHCRPYMFTLVDLDFKYIDFYKLSGYIGDNITGKTIVTNSSNSSTNFYIANNYFSKDDLDLEYEKYLEILETKEELTVEEWKYLTK